MERHKPFGLATVLRTKPSSAEDQNHRIQPLQLGELAPLRGMVGKLVIGKGGPWHDISSHLFLFLSSSVRGRNAGTVTMPGRAIAHTSCDMITRVRTPTLDDAAVLHRKCSAFPYARIKNLTKSEV